MNSYVGMTMVTQDDYFSQQSILPTLPAYLRLRDTVRLVTC